MIRPILSRGCGAKVEVSLNQVSDETTILGFQHPLEEHRLTRRIFDAAADLFGAKARNAESKRTGRDESRHFEVKLHGGTGRRVRGALAVQAAMPRFREQSNPLHDEGTVLSRDRKADPRQTFRDARFENPKRNRAESP